MERARIDPAESVREDEELALARKWTLPTARNFTLSGVARLDAHADEGITDALLGVVGPTATSTRRLPGDLLARATSAIDGDPTTAWTPAFDTPPDGGDAIDLNAGRPVTFSRMDLQVVADGRHSVPTHLRIESRRPGGGQHHHPRDRRPARRARSSGRRHGPDRPPPRGDGHGHPLRVRRRPRADHRRLVLEPAGPHAHRHRRARCAGARRLGAFGLVRHRLPDRSPERRWHAGRRRHHWHGRGRNRGPAAAGEPVRALGRWRSSSTAATTCCGPRRAWTPASTSTRSSCSRRLGAARRHRSDR